MSKSTCIAVIGSRKEWDLFIRQFYAVDEYNLSRRELTVNGIKYVYVSGPDRARGVEWDNLITLFEPNPTQEQREAYEIARVYVGRRRKNPTP